MHDYLVNRGGAERVVAAMHRVWPDAPIFTSLYFPEETHEELRDADVRTSSLQKRVKRAEDFRKFLPLYPRAFAKMDLSGFDVVVSSSAGFAHHVRPPAGTCHVNYCYSPPRFLWGPHYDVANVAPAWARAAVPPVRAWLRRLDKRAAARPHFTLAVSGLARKRIREVYGKASTVLYPPVFTDRFGIGPRTEDAYLVVSRLLPHRNVALAVRAFTEMNRKLIVVGDGPSRGGLEGIAGSTIEFRGAVGDAELVKLYGRCRGVVVPGEEDFGLIPLEANASGRPAIAFGQGGSRETVLEGRTGVLFSRAEPGQVVAAIERAEAIDFDPAILRAHAESFGEPVFAARLRAFVESNVASCFRCAQSRRGGLRRIAGAVDPRSERGSA